MLGKYFGSKQIIIFFLLRCKIDKSVDPLHPTCKKTFDEYHLFFSCHDLELCQTNLLQMVRDTLTLYYDEDITVNLKVLLGEFY